MKNFGRLWHLSLVLKLILAALIPLSADEAYYWVWSQRPQLSYFDHPPMVAWLFSAGHFLEPFMNAVRWPAVILGHGIIGLWYLLLKDRIPYEKFNTWIYLVLFSPLLGFGSLIITPDLPVLFFWTLSLLLTIKALEQKKLIFYALLGLSLGLGFCSKYHIVLFVPCLIAYLSIEKKWQSVQWKGVLLTILTGLIFSSPVIIWNIQNGFASFEFQLKHGLEKGSYDPEWTYSYVLGQILILFPLVLWAALKATVPTEFRWLKYFGWGPIIFFFLTSFKAVVEANWPIIGYPAILTMALFHPKIRSWLKVYVVFWGLIFIVTIGSVFVPKLRSLNEKIEEPYVFKELSTLTQQFSPLYASSYQMASSLWYFSKIPVFKLQGISRFDFFDTFAESIPNGNHFYLLKRETNGLPPWLSQQQWTVKEVKRIVPDFVLLEFKRP
ncbi:MAG: ArnT family glycosyltransferase [Pseudobdellovibrionaceae bacterium]